MAEIKLSPRNKCAFMVTLEDVSTTPGDTMGEAVPLTSGAASAFLAVPNVAGTAPVAADPSLVASQVTHTANPDGDWLVVFDADVLTDALLETLFADAEPRAIVVVDGNVRAVVPLDYEPERVARVVR